MSAAKIKQRLGLTITVRSIQRVAERHVGKTTGINNSTANQIPLTMRPYVDWCLGQLGKDPNICGICEDIARCDIHHTKYEGATIYDLMYVCRSCNLARANKGLS